MNNELTIDELDAVSGSGFSVASFAPTKNSMGGTQITMGPTTVTVWDNGMTQVSNPTTGTQLITPGGGGSGGGHPA